MAKRSPQLALSDVSAVGTSTCVSSLRHGSKERSSGSQPSERKSAFHSVGNSPDYDRSRRRQHAFRGEGYSSPVQWIRRISWRRSVARWTTKKNTAGK